MKFVTLLTHPAHRYSEAAYDGTGASSSATIGLVLRSSGREGVKWRDTAFGPLRDLRYINLMARALY